MKEVISRAPGAQTTLHRDEHDVSGEYKVHTVVHNEHNIDQNTRIRNAGLMHQGKKTGLMDGGVIIRAFSVHPTEWRLFKKQNPGLYRRLLSRNEKTREKAAQQIAILHPEWVTNTGK